MEADLLAKALVRWSTRHGGALRHSADAEQPTCGQEDAPSRDPRVRFIQQVNKYRFGAWSCRMAAAGGTGGAGGDDRADASDGASRDTLWRDETLKGAASRVKSRIGRARKWRAVLRGIDALLGDTEDKVDLPHCHAGEVEEAARLIASAIAVNTTATSVECVHVPDCDAPLDSADRTAWCLHACTRTVWAATTWARVARGT